MLIFNNRGLITLAGVATILTRLCVSDASAQAFTSGNLVVSRLLYQDTGEAATLVPGVTPLPNTNGKKATNDGTFPGVFNNLTNDGNFGVIAGIYLDQLTTAGTLINTLTVPTSTIAGSFSSKSEGGLNLSQDGTKLTFTGYDAAPGALDRSNSNTPGIAVPGTTDTAAATFRKVAAVDAAGNFQTTRTNAYAGDNPRAAILGNNGLYYAVGNTGGTDATATGVQIITPGVDATSSSPGTTSAGSYNAGDNSLAKDNNFRGLTIFNNTLYASKGSGSKGTNTVYKIGNTGSLPTGTGNTISVLPGFPTALNANTSASALLHPFGLWFANAATLYVADEGNQAVADETNPDTSNPNAGLQKWINSIADGSGTWSRAYTLRLGLNLGQLYTVAGDSNSPAIDGLRDIAGKLNGDGTASIYAITSTVSSATEPGADPNTLVAITDILSATTLPGTESFTTLKTASYGEVLRGVEFAPAPVPEPSTFVTVGLGGLLLLTYRRKCS